jgi:hypothetical protein
MWCILLIFLALHSHVVSLIILLLVQHTTTQQTFYLYDTSHKTNISSFAVYHTKIYFPMIRQVAKKIISIRYLDLTLDVMCFQLFLKDF